MNYTIQEIEINGRPEYGIRLKNAGLEHIMFTYGKVSFDEDNKDEKAILHFEYDIVEGELSAEQKEKFEPLIGDLLIEFIKTGLQDRSLVYTGGTDED